MADINAMIAGGVNPIQVQDPLNQMAKYQDIAVNALKMQEYQRGLEEENMLRELRKSGVNPKSKEYIAKAYEISPTMGMKLEKAQADIRKSANEVTKQDLEIARQQYGNLAFNTSDENVLAHLQDGVLNGRIDQTQAQRQWQQIAPMNAAQRKQFFENLALETDKRLGLEETKRSHKVHEGIAGGHLALARERLRKDMDPQLQATMAEAKAFGENIGKNRAAAVQALPAAVQSANEGIRLIDEMIGKPTIKDAKGNIVQKGTKPHPGFSDYVGATWKPGMRFIEGSDAASFEVRQKQIEGKAFLEAFNALKGGGSITEKEGEKGTAAIMRMNKAASEEEYMKAARELQNILRTGVERARMKATGSVVIQPQNVVPTSAIPRLPAGAEAVIDFSSLK